MTRRPRHARRHAPALPIGASAWAATEQLIDLGGEVVEDLLIVQNDDRDDTSARFTALSEAHFKRSETLERAALRAGPYQGLQQTIRFDANGDTERKVFFTQIRGERYVRLK